MYRMVPPGGKSPATKRASGGMNRACCLSPFAFRLPPFACRLFLHKKARLQEVAGQEEPPKVGVPGVQLVMRLPITFTV